MHIDRNVHIIANMNIFNSNSRASEVWSSAVVGVAATLMKLEDENEYMVIVVLSSATIFDTNDDCCRW
jgi:hypothetical protein